MSHPTSTRGLLTIPFGVPAYWTSEQALAVFEFLDELRDVVWNYYSMQLLDQAREQYSPTASDQSREPLPDPGDTAF